MLRSRVDATIVDSLVKDLFNWCFTRVAPYRYRNIAEKEIQKVIRL